MLAKEDRNSPYEDSLYKVHNIEEVNQLLKKGMPIDFQNCFGETLLIRFALVCANEYAEVVAHLISLGADLNIKDKHGDTALKASFKKVKCDSAITLFEARTEAKEKNYPQEAIEEVDEEINLRLTLYYATDNLRIIKLLLENGAFFEKEEGVTYYQTLLQTNQNNINIYSILHEINKRYSYPDLAEYLIKLDKVLRKPLYSVLKTTLPLPNVLSQIILQYDDRVEESAHYLMKEDIELIYSNLMQHEQPNRLEKSVSQIKSISSVVLNGIFRSSLTPISGRFNFQLPEQKMETLPTCSAGEQNLFLTKRLCTIL